MATQNYFKAKNGLEAPSQHAIAITDSVVPSVKPTINLDFCNSESIDSRFAFSRNSIATYVGKDGYVKYADINEPRFDYDPITKEPKGLLLEESRQNLLRFSNEFHAGGGSGLSVWYYAGKIKPYAALAPDNTWSAAKLTEANTSVGVTSHSLYQAVTVANGSTYTRSVWLKSAGKRYAYMRHYDGVTNTGAIFDLQNGVVSYAESGITASITPYQNGWYRCAVTVVAASTSERWQLQPANGATDVNNYVGDGVSGVYIWGAQVELGPYVTSYIPSITAFASRATSATCMLPPMTHPAAPAMKLLKSDVNRTNNYVADGYGSWIPTGLFFEKPSTNLLTNSAVASGSWSVSSATLSVGSEYFQYGPWNSTSANLLREASGTAEHEAYLSATLSTNTTYTFSVYAKAKERTRIALMLGGGSNHARAIFNLTDGTTTYTGSTASGTVVQAYTERLYNGWFRCVLVASLSVVTGSSVVQLFLHNDVDSNSSYAGDGSSGLYVWGAQLETGDYPTSLIPTSNATASRALDLVGSVSSARAAEGGDFGSYGFVENLYNPNEGSVVIEALSFGKLNSGNNSIMMQFDNDTEYTTNMALSYNRTFCMYRANGGGQHQNIINQTASVASIAQAEVTNPVMQTNTYYMISAAFNSSSYSYVIDGVKQNVANSVVNPPSTYPPARVTALRIGSTSQGDRYWCGYIKKISYYPAKISDAEMSALTSKL